MQAEIERVKRDFVCGEVVQMLSGNLAGAEIRFESETDRDALFISLRRRPLLGLRPLTLRPPRST